MAVRRLDQRRKRKTKVQPSQQCRKRAKPGRLPSEQDSTHSYRRAIQYACEKGKLERWSPLQLRHTRATEIREKFGLEAAQVILGHSRADTTEIYAETNKKRAMEMVSECG